MSDKQLNKHVYSEIKNMKLFQISKLSRNRLNLILAKRLISMKYMLKKTKMANTSNTQGALTNW